MVPPVRIRVLIVAPNFDAAQRLATELARAGFDPDWVWSNNIDDYRIQLTREFDIQLAHEKMSNLDALQALELLQVNGANIPMIVVSATPSVEFAVEAMRRGAFDYLPRDRLATRLASAVSNALHLKEQRDQKERGESRRQTAADVFKRVVEHSLVGIQILLDGKYAYANRKLGELFGYTPEELLNLQSWTQVVAESDRERVLDQIRRRVSGETPYAQYVFRGLRKDGREIDVEVRSDRTEFDGRPAVIGTLIDVTERRRAETILRESEERFRGAFESTNVAMVLTDLEHRFVRANTAFARLFGYTDEEILKLSMIDITHPDDLTESLESRMALLAGEREFFQLEKRYLCKDGRVLWGRTNVSLLRHSDGTPHLYVGQVQDLTESKRLEETARKHLAELAHAGRLSAVGEMLSGLAHEINQPLAAASNYARACIRFAKSKDNVSNEELQEWMEKAAAQSDRAIEIVKRLKSFMKKERSIRVELNINTLVENVVNLPALLTLPSGFDSPTTVSMQLEENPPLIYADKVQIEQVLVNLIRNANDAMQGLPENECHLTVKTRQRPNAIEVSVTDAGHGISPEHQARLFQPFFTTKTEGMGLGLSISRSIVEDHAGRMFVQSEVGKGTIVSFLLPIEQESEQVETPKLRVSMADCQPV